MGKSGGGGWKGNPELSIGYFELRYYYIKQEVESIGSGVRRNVLGWKYRVMPPRLGYTESLPATRAVPMGGVGPENE